MLGAQNLLYRQMLLLGWSGPGKLGSGLVIVRSHKVYASRYSQQPYSLKQFSDMVENQKSPFGLHRTMIHTHEMVCLYLS